VGRGLKATGLPPPTRKPEFHTDENTLQDFAADLELDARQSESGDGLGNALAGVHKPHLEILSDVHILH
jgi:hypothetical protein